MRALVKEDRKTGLSLRDIQRPDVTPGHLLVRVRACSICGGDNYLYKWTKIMDTWNISLPLVIGHEFCGDIVELGDGAQNTICDFRIGDRIAADSHLFCGKCVQCLHNRKHNCQNVKILGIHTNGCFAEYVNVPASIAFRIPESISDEEAALLEPFGVGVKSYNLASPSITDKVAVVGGGPIGLFVARLCVVSGNRSTCLFEPSHYRRELARKVGVGRCHDPHDHNGMTRLRDSFSVVFEASGTEAGLEHSLGLAGPNGTVIIIGAQQDKVLVDVKNQIMLKELTVRGTFGRLIWDTWFEMMEMMNNCDIGLSDFITHRFDFEHFEDAFATSLGGNCGKVVLLPHVNRVHGV